LRAKKPLKHNILFLKLKNKRGKIKK